MDMTSFSRKYLVTIHDNAVPKDVAEDYAVRIECAQWTPKGQLLVSVGGGPGQRQILLVDGKTGAALVSFDNALVPDQYS